jgi:Spx/MgsR family transcriptional regulator
LAHAVTLYGIANCDQVRRARGWLDAHRVDYHFHDFKRAGLDAARVNAWIAAAGAGRLVNRKGTTWRKLTEAERTAADDNGGAGALMTANPSLVKRPVLDIDGSITIGFDTTVYGKLFT